jgi:hypothetical protein
MSKLLQLRGGTTTEHATFTGALREVTVDTTKDTLVVHDGATAGGFPQYPAPTITGTSVTATNASFHIASAGGITITLPITPTAGNYVIIKDGTGLAADTPFTVARNGSNIASSATDLTFDKNFAEVVMTYVNATIGWSV